MSRLLIAVSIGNTRTRVGAFQAGELKEVSTFQNHKLDRIEAALRTSHDMLKCKGDVAVLMASVEPSQEKDVTQLIQEKLQLRVERVESDWAVPIGRQLDPEALPGEDRLLNAAAAYDLLKQACVVVDAGTAITVDFIDGAGTFHGGVIAPGVSVMLEALNQKGANLPEVELKRPEETIGHNTVEAMRAGVFHAARGLVHEVVERYAMEVGQYPLVLATGGDAQLLFRDYDLVDRVVPDLTLYGLAVTLQKHLGEDGGEIAHGG